MRDAAGVDVQQRHDQGDLIIELSGDLDAISAPHLVERVGALPLDVPDLERVVVDLAGLDFLDSSGISALIELRRRSDAAGLAFRVTNVRAVQRQVLEIVGLLEYFHVDEDPELR